MSRFPSDGHECVVTEESKRMLSRTKELCYLTSFVIRLFENAEKVPYNPPLVALAALCKVARGCGGCLAGVEGCVGG